MAFFVQLLFAALFLLASYFLTPKPKRQKGPEYSDPEDPTASAGTPIPVLFGCMRIKGVNVVAIPDKAFRTGKINA